MNKEIPTHAVKAVIKNSEGQILFLQRNPLKGAVANWDFPGGIVEDGEEDKIALQREIKEELGVDSSIGDELGRWTFFRPFDEKTVAVTNYSAELVSTSIKLSDEHVDSQWINFDECKKLPVKDQSIFGALGN
jgi:8-oxo-dGTP diphosphatase